MRWRVAHMLTIDSKTIKVLTTYKLILKNFYIEVCHNSGLITHLKKTEWFITDLSTT